MWCEFSHVKLNNIDWQDSCPEQEGQEWWIVLESLSISFLRDPVDSQSIISGTRRDEMRSAVTVKSSSEAAVRAAARGHWPRQGQRLGRSCWLLFPPSLSWQHPGAAVSCRDWRSAVESQTAASLHTLQLSPRCRERAALRRLQLWRELYTWIFKLSFT